MDRAIHMIDIGPGTGIEASESNKSMFNLVWKSVTCTGSYHSSGIKWYKAVQQRNWCLSPFRLVHNFLNVSLAQEYVTGIPTPTHIHPCVTPLITFFFFFWLCYTQLCPTLCDPVDCSPGFPGGLVVNNVPVNAGNARDMGSIPGSGRSLGVGHGNPLQYSCLG